MRTAVLTRDGKKTSFAVTDVSGWSKVASSVTKFLKPGIILAISGPLGAGKTTFVQALAKTLGIERIPQSPTFALMRSYPIPRSSAFYKIVQRLIHVDAYRIEDERDVLALDLDEELADGKSILVLEWPEKVPSWLKRRSNVLRIDIGVRFLG